MLLEEARVEACKRSEVRRNGLVRLHEEVQVRLARAVHEGDLRYCAIVMLPTSRNAFDINATNWYAWGDGDDDRRRSTRWWRWWRWCRLVIP